MVFVNLKIFFNFFLIQSLAFGNLQKENVKVHDPPCFFNPLCTCSKAYPDLGRVICKDVPMLNIPRHINMSKVFMLHMENNFLRYIEPHFFSETGLYKIEIIQNLLKEIDEESFSGLERSLWELNFRHNKFRNVPSESFRYLQKLKVLDLSDNEITEVRPEDWLGVKDSLKTLMLSGNKISNLRPKTFSMLQQLEILDLSRNSILELDTSVFKDGPKQLVELHLADNLFSDVPINQISELRQLRYLDLSLNRITEIQDFSLDRGKGNSATLLLDTLRLDYNQIQFLPSESFKHFPVINKTYLNGNPIEYVEKDAFQRTKIQELHLRDCEISELTQNAFSGLSNYLEVLDFEGNNLTEIPENFFKDYVVLKTLNLKNNLIKEFDYEKIFNGRQTSLNELDISGQLNTKVNFQNGAMLNNMRSVTLSNFIDSSLESKDLPEFLNQLEEIKVSHSNIKSIRSHAFKNVRGLRRLDLSENSISTIENEAFSEVAHSLVYLSLANGLSSSVSQLPSKIFEDLTSIEILDLSNNRLKSLPQKVFRSMKRLKTIWLQDNFIESIPKRAFQDDIHSELSTIQLSFNQLSSIESRSFTGLNNLESLWLNDNRINVIEKRAFMNLNHLQNLHLRGNKISLLREETFQGLPELEKLDLAFNKLKILNYDCLEQVGTLSSFDLNLSFNNIEQLTASSLQSDTLNFSPLHVNIKGLDLSHNNISDLRPRAFKPIEPSVTHLYLSHNKLNNITKSTFGNMKHLQWLDLSHNDLRNLEFDAFASTKRIQVLYLSNNQLHELPIHLFRGFNLLRIVDLSHNNFRTLPQNLFIDGILEKLDVSNNHLTRVPVSCFSVQSSKTLIELDLSENAIVTLPPPDVFSRFKSLHLLNLSKNRIMRVEDGTFSFLRRLCILDVSHNIDLTLDSKGNIFKGLEDTLADLYLKNLSLNAVPALHLPSLVSLDVSNNNIFSIPFEFPHNISNLRRLELANNKLPNVPPAINAFSQLEYLGLLGNPMESINFQQSYSITEINIKDIDLDTLEKGALGKIPLLETLKLTISQDVSDFNFPNLIKNNNALRNLEIEIMDDGRLGGFSLKEDFNGFFPNKMKNLTLIGRGLKILPDNLLQGIQSPSFNLVLFNTSVEEIKDDVFLNAPRIRNLSLFVQSNRLKSVENPNTGDFPNTPKKIFLQNLQISDNDWVCDCTIGWIEGWERKKRHYLCLEDSEQCFLGSDDLRNAVCSNRKPNTISEVFKSELECEWNSSKALKPSLILTFLLIKALLYLMYM